MGIRTAGCSQKLWRCGHKKLPIVLGVRWAWASSISQWRVREPPRRTQTQPARGTEVLKREAPAMMTVGCSCALMMLESYVYTFHQLESIISLLRQLFPRLRSLSWEGDLEMLHLSSPTPSELYTDTLIKGLASPPRTPL